MRPEDEQFVNVTLLDESYNESINCTVVMNAVRGGNPSVNETLRVNEAPVRFTVIEGDICCIASSQCQVRCAPPCVARALQ